MTTTLTEGLRYDRELSWLSFNHRVLQEAEDTANPLYERLKFLAIFSSNLDEFYRVRVASIKYLLRMKAAETDDLDIPYYHELLETINLTVDQQQEAFGRIFRKQIIPELRNHGINLLEAGQVSRAQLEQLEEQFFRDLYPHLEPLWLGGNDRPFLYNGALYFAVQLKASQKPQEEAFAIVNLPDQDGKKRFIELQGNDGSTAVLFVDEVVRLFIDRVFEGYQVTGCYAVKLSRDADLHLDEALRGDLVEKIKQSLEQRENGLPTRFLYDKEMPGILLEKLQTQLGLQEDELIPGGRYHNFDDLFHFPKAKDSSLYFDPMPPLSQPVLDQAHSTFQAIREQDVALFFPYHPFDYILNWLEETVNDPAVRSIKITLYRVAQNSKVADALIRAAKNGKEVTVFVEVKARMDELNNIEWLEEMRQSGVEILAPYEHWKVHSKLFVVEREEHGQLCYYAYLGTGNFNEKTTKFYADVALLTADQRLAGEANEIFEYLRDLDNRACQTQQLMVAPANMRSRFEELVQNEIDNARSGLPAYMRLKMNSLQDKGMIKKLYEASNAGVVIQLIVRGICCLIPGEPGKSENIRVVSILDRFLEHSRAYLFANGGEEVLYLASADWMKRNLSRRVEVAFPVHNPTIKRQVKAMLAYQWHDNTKARLINANQDNPYQTSNSQEHIRSQYDLYQFLQKENLEA